MWGSGLVTSSKGMLPGAIHSFDCPCEFDVFAAWEGPQDVVSFYPPVHASITAFRVLDRLWHWPYDQYDGVLVYDLGRGPFASTNVVGETIHDSVDAAATDVYGTTLDDPQDLDELDEDGPLSPGSITVHWTTGAVPTTSTDDGAGGFAAPLAAGSSVDYCTKALTLDFTGSSPDTGTDITIDYTVFDKITVSVRVTGTKSGGFCADAGAGVVSYTAWDGFIEGEPYTVVAGTYDFSLLADDTYFIYINSLGALAVTTSLGYGGLVLQQILCRVEITGGAVSAGPFDMRVPLDFIQDYAGEDTDEPYDFHYYKAMTYDNVTLAWHACNPPDYALSYDSTRLFQWLWNHLPQQWRADDTINQIALTETAYDDGQVLNINEDANKVRGQLYRFLKFFGLELERDRAFIRALAILHIDPDRCSPASLHLLAAALGGTIPRNLSLGRRRAYLKHMTGVYQRKGTVTAGLMAAYRQCGILPAYKELYENVLYAGNFNRHSFDTSQVALIGTPTDPNYYSWAPTRENHYHERGLNLFFTGPTNPLFEATTAYVLKLDVKTGSGPIYETDAATARDSLLEIDIDNYLRPNTVTINWTSGAVAKSMADDGSGGFLLAGDGNPAGSCIDYLTRKIVFDSRGDVPDAGTAITVDFTTTSRGVFKRTKNAVEKNLPGTAHIVYYINGDPMAASR